MRHHWIYSGAITASLAMGSTACGDDTTPSSSGSTSAGEASSASADASTSGAASTSADASTSGEGPTSGDEGTSTGGEDLPEPLQADIYVDNTLTGSLPQCAAGEYSVANRDCFGTDGIAYPTIQEALDNVAVGDVIQMRGGTYADTSIRVPQSSNGTSWDEGNFTTLMSYPGEWAKIDASGLEPTTDQTISAVIFGYTGFDTGSDSNYVEYWDFSNFEITGGGAGVHMKMRHVRWRYMYIHDNGRADVSDLQSGILAVNPQYVEIKYSHFKDNINEAAPNLNMAHIMFDGDYRDTSSNDGRGDSFLENGSTHHNEVAYNYFELTGSNVGAQHIGIRQKNQTRFGYNDRSPLDMTYAEYGDNIHHNIVTGSVESIGVGQDFLQIHHNITDSGINVGRFGDIPTTYNAVIYNNTVIEPETASFITSSGVTTDGNTSMLNFYDALPQKTVHPHVDFYNNIADDNMPSYHDMPFLLHWDMPENSANPDQDTSDLVLENNLIHSNANEFDLLVGHNHDTATFSGCDLQEMSLADFNACSATWRNVDTVVNWNSSDAGLYIGESGSDAYTTNPSFPLGNANTICDGGRGGGHPYLPGTTLPTYVGATHPTDNAWVAGVLSDVTSSQWLQGQIQSTPDWVQQAADSPSCD